MKKAKARAKKSARINANIAYYQRQGIDVFNGQTNRFFAGLIKDRSGKLYTRDVRGTRLVGHSG